MSKVVVLFAIFVVTVNCGCHSPPSYGTPNMYPIQESTKNTQFLNSTQNGKLYLVTVPHDGSNTSSSFTLLHLWGTPYEMGYAQGELLKDKVNVFITTTWEYMMSQVEDVLPWFPVWLQEMISNWGLDVALDFTYYATIEYTPPHFYEEMRGISDASGVDYNTIVRVHMIAGLTQGACSMFGAWGEAINSDQKLLQLRALDWDMKGPFRDYSQITVYHPNKGDGHPFANVGMMGFIGGLTGISSQQLAISEIGVGYPDASFGSVSRLGYPFIFLLRDILQYDITVDDAISRMANAHRTCDLILGVGDGKLNIFRGMQYSYSVLNVMDDENLMPDNSTWHPRISDIVYWGMDWLCPSFNTVMSEQLKKYYGQINAELAIQYISSVVKTGDNHLAYSDLTNMQFYVSFAAPFGVAGPENAYDRQFTKFDAVGLFNEQSP